MGSRDAAKALAEGQRAASGQASSSGRTGPGDPSWTLAAGVGSIEAAGRRGKSNKYRFLLIKN